MIIVPCAEGARYSMLDCTLYRAPSAQAHETRRLLAPKVQAHAKYVNVSPSLM